MVEREEKSEVRSVKLLPESDTRFATCMCVYYPYYIVVSTSIQVVDNMVILPSTYYVLNLEA